MRCVFCILAFALALIALPASAQNAPPYSILEFE
jgi:hypothetical protein